MKVFVSSSWRNETQPSVVSALRTAGHTVYDFREPSPGEQIPGFSWYEVAGDLPVDTTAGMKAARSHPRVQEAFRLDMGALRECDALVMVQPCGRSAALELGWAAGASKRTLVLLADGEPELMLLMADHLCLSIDEVVSILDSE